MFGKLKRKDANYLNDRKSDFYKIDFKYFNKDIPSKMKMFFAVVLMVLLSCRFQSTVYAGSSENKPYFYNVTLDKEGKILGDGDTITVTCELANYSEHLKRCTVLINAYSTNISFELNYDEDSNKYIGRYTLGNTQDNPTRACYIMMISSEYEYHINTYYNEIENPFGIRSFYYCNRCKNGIHYPVVEKSALEPTCSQEGYTERVSCSLCRTVLKEEKIIPVMEHTVVVIPEVAASCTLTGLTEGKKCSICGTIIVEQKMIPKTKHKEVTIARKAATCTSIGLTEGKKCSVCGTVTVAQQTIPALGHAMGNWVTTQVPSVVADGVQTRTCSRCGYAETTTIARLAATGSLNATNVPLKVKQSATLTVKDMAAGDYVASWTSSDTKIVTVNNGKITGKKKGTAKVTATLASGCVLTATVKVQTGNVKTTVITVNTRNVTLSQNQSFQLTSVVAPFTSKDKLSYKTANKKIATVSGNGKITAKKAGKTTITVKSGKKSVKVTVNVIGVKTTDISVNTTQLNLKVKKKATIKAYVTPKNTSENITYKTSNKKVATVDKKGKVTAKKAGTATITVKSGSKSVKVNVTVTK